MANPRSSQSSSQVPGPPVPPLVPGHLGAPLYDELAQMLVILSVYETLGQSLPTRLAWRIDPWADRVREWGKREIQRGNFDRIMEAAGVR